MSVLNSRWVPLNKFQKKYTGLPDDNNINEILLNSIQEQINYHQASNVRLSRGLYLGYLKMQSSVEQLSIIVPAKTPNVLPHCKIRDNPHISAEEWRFLKRTKLTNAYEPNGDKPTSGQKMFLDAFTSAARCLFKYMEIPANDIPTHRLYDLEVIELDADVSFLIVCSNAQASFSITLQKEIFLQRSEFLSISPQAFEMISLKTYQTAIIDKYSRLSCILELDVYTANQSHREAFSNGEVNAAKERLAKLQDLSVSVNTIWKSVRWLLDTMSFARDRTPSSGLVMKGILESSSPVESTINQMAESVPVAQQQLLQPPPRTVSKGSPGGRGSWPGPTHSLGANGLLGTEHSKSEQQLSGTSFNISSRYLSTTSGMENATSRKNSADSNYSHSGNSYYSAGWYP